MGIIYGLVAALCFFFAFDDSRQLWRRFRAGEAILPNSIEKQSFAFALAFFVFGIVLALQAFGLIRIL